MLRRDRTDAHCHHETTEEGNITLTAFSTEAYKIVVTKKLLVISGLTPNGVFYGIQTLRKSLPILSTAADVTLPAATVTDSPRFIVEWCSWLRPPFLSCWCRKEYIDFVSPYTEWTLSIGISPKIKVGVSRLRNIQSWPRSVLVRKHTVIGHNSPKYMMILLMAASIHRNRQEIVAYAKRTLHHSHSWDWYAGTHALSFGFLSELGCTGGPMKG